MIKFAPITDYAYTPEEWRRMGLSYGYPDCCIEEFEEKYFEGGGASPDRPFFGTGFVPCERCEDLIRAIGEDRYVEEHIVPRRKISTPFPIDE